VIVVSDSSPLHYLILLGKANLLRDLFGEVVIPRSVREELGHPQAPSDVREWLRLPPAWASVLAAAAVDLSLPLGKGEREAICLAQELHADLLLADDKKARRIAQQRGLVVTGTLAVLRAAHDRGLVRLPEMIRQLRGCGFRMSEKLSRHVCSEAERRPGADTPGVS
jgi:predicted nucleic acid-binding protein